MSKNKKEYLMNPETTCPLRVYALIALLEFACTSKKC